VTHASEGPSSSDVERLEVLVGRWRTLGWTRGGDGTPPERIDATDTYGWLPGRFSLLHSVDARVGDRKVEGAEIIGFDPSRGTYATRYFGSDGSTAYEATLVGDGETLVWTMRSRTTRFAGRFSEDGNTIKGLWELLDERSGWRPWMDITLTKHVD
jgi:hypothetical protein